MWSLPARYVVAALALAALGGAAQASVCQGPAAAPGEVLRGPILHVVDGETLCIAQGFAPDAWTPLRLAPEGTIRASRDQAPPRGALMAAAFGKDAVCTVETVAAGQAIARCTVDGRSLSRQARAPAALKAAAEWR